MIVCSLCKNTGRITERYVDYSLGLAPIDFSQPAHGEILAIKTHEVECPWCLGFSAVPLRPKL